MATYYVWSGASGGAEDGSSKTDAYLTVEDAFSGSAVAGDILLIHTGTSPHYENRSTATDWPVGVPTGANPIHLVGVDMDDSDAYLPATVAIIENASGYTLGLNGSMAVFGLYFKTNGNLLTVKTGVNQEVGYYEDCTFEEVNQTQLIRLTNGYYRECDIICDYVGSDNGNQEIIGGSIDVDHTQWALYGSRNTIYDGVDFSASTSPALFYGDLSSSYEGFGCKLPTSINIDHASLSSSVKIFAVDDSTGNDINRIEHHPASYQSEVGFNTIDTVTYRSGGATYDGTNEYSIKYLSDSNCTTYQPLKTMWQVIPSDLLGAAGSKTVTIHIANATADLDNDEVWLEVEYFKNSGDTLIAFATDRVASILDTPAAQTDDSSSTWSPSKTYMQTVAVTFTTGRTGLARWRVCCGKASTTLWIDPNPVIT